jgi:hypothetical protein
VQEEKFAPEKREEHALLLMVRVLAGVKMVTPVLRVRGSADARRVMLVHAAATGLALVRKLARRRAIVMLVGSVMDVVSSVR